MRKLYKTLFTETAKNCSEKQVKGGILQKNLRQSYKYFQSHGMIFKEQTQDE